jgi:hypothetical protein
MGCLRFSLAKSRRREKDGLTWCCFYIYILFRCGDIILSTHKHLARLLNRGAQADALAARVALEEGGVKALIGAVSAEREQQACVVLSTNLLLFFNVRILFCERKNTGCST